MNIYWKKATIAVLMIFCTALLFAQTEDDPEPVKLGITDGDIKNFVKNAEAIEKELERYDVSLEQMSGDSKETLEALPELERILGKYGISGPHRTGKVCILALGYAAEAGRREMESDPQSAALMKSMGIDPYSWLAALIHPDDMETIRRNMKTLDAAFGDAKAKADSSDDFVPEPTPERKERRSQKSEELKEEIKEDIKDDLSDLASSLYKAFRRK